MAPECKVADDCPNAPYQQCTTQGQCKHKELMPVLPKEIAGLVILPILLGFANLGGIGGGGIIIPLSIAFFGLTTKEAAAISNSTIFAGALVRFAFFSIWSKHPTKKDATIIDYSLASVMIPSVLVGSYMGILINLIFPEGVLTIILVLILIYVTYESFTKAVKKYKDENASLRSQESKESLLHRNQTLPSQVTVEENRAM